MHLFNPQATYRKVKELESLPLEKAYISIPDYRKISTATQKRLKKLASCDLQFINDKNLIRELTVRLKNTFYTYDLIISLSIRGQELYKSFQSKKLFDNVEHINLPVNRKALKQYKFPKYKDKSILVIDDIFYSGLTLKTVINVYKENNRVSCLFLFGPHNIIEEFKILFPEIPLVYALFLKEDPRKIAFKISELNSLCISIKNVGKNVEIIKRGFIENGEEAVNIFRSL